MKTFVKNISVYFSEKPKVLFLIDGLGAALTAFTLFFVLKHNYELFGIPPNVLNYLSVIGLAYCIYSAVCYFTLKKIIVPFLRLIAVMNFLYCLLSIGMLFIHYSELTRVGLAYLLAEITIIAVLGYTELKVANTLSLSKRF